MNEESVVQTLGNQAAGANRQAWSDRDIESAVASAEPVVLRGLLYFLTGDEDAAATKVEKAGSGVFDGFSVLDPHDQELLREHAVAFLKRYRDEGTNAVAPGVEDRTVRSMTLTVGEEIDPRETELWAEELGLDPWAFGFSWAKEPDPARLSAFSVIVIGAGMGGLNAAVHLKNAGIAYTVVERDSALGGTWFQNRYPGARVDTASRTYTHTYAMDYEWPGAYCIQEENLRHLNWIADRFGIREDIRFDSEVLSLRWDEDAANWEITLRDEGGVQVLHANAVISSIGIFSTPNIPALEGAERFLGAAFHSARWPEGFSTRDKRIAVIGTGCTGYQMVPEIARDAKEVTVFQRTPQWPVPVKGYLSPFPPEASWLDRNFPLHKNFKRLRATWLQGPGTRARMSDIDPEWHDPLTLSAANKAFRDDSIAFIEKKLGHRPELAEKMVPPHPIMSARPVVVDSEYSIYDALNANVSLVSEGVRGFTEDGVVDGDGVEHKVDAVVYATGFKTNDFLFPMEVRGRGGESVDALWAKDGPRAYLGTMLPGFPNFFMIFGPNTTPQGGVSLVNTEAITTRYILSCISLLIEGGKTSIEPTREAYDRYNEELDAFEARKIYSGTRAKTYYQSSFGRSVVNCPLPGLRMWTLLRRPNTDELVVR